MKEYNFSECLTLLESFSCFWGYVSSNFDIPEIKPTKFIVYISEDNPTEVAVFVKGVLRHFDNVLACLDSIDQLRSLGYTAFEKEKSS